MLISYKSTNKDYGVVLEKVVRSYIRENKSFKPVEVLKHVQDTFPILEEVIEKWDKPSDSMIIDAGLMTASLHETMPNNADLKKAYLKTFNNFVKPDEMIDLMDSEKYVVEILGMNDLEKDEFYMMLTDLHNERSKDELEIILQSTLNDLEHQNDMISKINYISILSKFSNLTGISDLKGISELSEKIIHKTKGGLLFPIKNRRLFTEMLDSLNSYDKPMDLFFDQVEYLSELKMNHIVEESFKKNLQSVEGNITIKGKKPQNMLLMIPIISYLSSKGYNMIRHNIETDKDEDLVSKTNFTFRKNLHERTPRIELTEEGYLQIDDIDKSKVIDFLCDLMSPEKFVNYFIEGMQTLNKLKGGIRYPYPGGDTMVLKLGGIKYSVKKYENIGISRQFWNDLKVKVDGKSESSLDDIVNCYQDGILPLAKERIREVESEVMDRLNNYDSNDMNVGTMILINKFSQSRPELENNLKRMKDKNIAECMMTYFLDRDQFKGHYEKLEKEQKKEFIEFTYTLKDDVINEDLNDFISNDDESKELIEKIGVWNI